VSQSVGVAILTVLFVGFLVGALCEVRRWRHLDSFLSRRQRIVRGTNLCLGGLALLLVGALSLDLIPEHPLWPRLSALCGVVALLILVVALVLWDLREIALRRLDGEMTLWAEGARTLLQRAKDRPKGATEAARSTAPLPPGPETTERPPAGPAGASKP
jgi:hypothetical protein